MGGAFNLSDGSPIMNLRHGWASVRVNSFQGLLGGQYTVDEGICQEVIVFC